MGWIEKRKNAIDLLQHCSVDAGELVPGTKPIYEALCKEGLAIKKKLYGDTYGYVATDKLKKLSEDQT